MRNATAWAVAVAVLVPAMACNSDGETGSGGSALQNHTGEQCMPGTYAPCECAGAAAPMLQACGVSGVFDACPCPVQTLGGAGTTNSFAGTSGGGGFETSGGTGGFDVGGGGTAGVVTTAGVGGTAGTAGAGGTAGTDGTAGTGVSTSGGDPKLPTTSEACPTLATGNVTVLGQSVQLWVGAKQTDKKGALFFYWHGTGSTSGEATGGMGSALQEITAEGGMVASFSTSTKAGQSTANNVWYTGDFAMVDVLVKCAVEQLNVDTRRIYTGGCSAGGLQAGAMVTGRASYLAAAMPNSGGVIEFFAPASDDPSHVPSVMTTHGVGGADVVGVDFEDTSNALCNRVTAAGGFAVDCGHSGGHCQSPSADKAAQWAFLKAHPYGVDPEPYAAGLPATFPSYCKIVP